MHLTSIENTAFTILRTRGYIPMFSPITWDVANYWSKTLEYKAAFKQSEYIWKRAEEFKRKERDHEKGNR